MAQDFDFWLNGVGTGLGFNLATSKDRPYERATAQFRKDQFDAAPTVGDQSLAGWWTRGQLSFHKGAGIKYYEVLDGETIFNRFKDSSGVYPWEPGELTLATSSTSVALTGVTDAVGSTYAGNGVMALVGGGLRFVDSAAGSALVNAKTLATYSGITSITSSGSSTYTCEPTAIKAKNGAAVTYTNYMPNPSFASGVPIGLNFTGGWGGALGPGSLTVTNPSTTAGTIYRSIGGLTVGVSYTVRVVASSLASSIAIAIDATNGGVADAKHTAYSSALTQSLTFTATAATHALYIDPAALGTGSSQWVFTSIDFIDDPYATGPANPDDDARWTWSGVAHQSNSQRVVAANSYWDVLWNPPAGRTWAKVWFAKGRLFAIDDLGKWYTLSTAGGTAAAADVFWSPNLGTSGWGLAESPGPVYISQGTNIYSVTPDSNGLIPTITTPVVAASFPTGETISCIFAYLGGLIACTNLGMRVAVIQSNGSLAYGAHSVVGDFSGTVRVTALRELAYVVGKKTGDATPSLWTVNMLARVSDLEPVYAKLAPVAAGTLFGATVTPDGLVMAWDGSGFYRTGSGLQSTGYVTTGFHRLGTLDPKSFRYLRVKTQGTVGSVRVDALLPDGTSALVGTVTAGNLGDLDLSMAVPSPVEYLGLKFTLTGSGVAGPTLLGYQLKALPVPKRQRMIRVPLLLFSGERNRSGQAMLAGPWERLAALEALEESNAVVTFSDRVTGETGSAYIEAIEVSSQTPPAAGNDGVGGFIWLTLRKISA